MQSQCEVAAWHAWCRFALLMDEGEGRRYQPEKVRDDGSMDEKGGMEKGMSADQWTSKAIRKGGCLQIDG